MAQLSSLTQSRKRIQLAVPRVVTGAMPESSGDNVLRTMRDEARY